MLFGLKNAPTSFQKFMVEVMGGYLNIFVTGEHLTHAQLVLERLRTHKLRCAPEKCRFAFSKLEYLAHSIGAAGNRPLERHLKEIREVTRPTTLKQLHYFLGLCGWLRPYIENYFTIAAPLTDLLGATL